MFLFLFIHPRDVYRIKEMNNGEAISISCVESIRYFAVTKAARPPMMDMIAVFESQ